MKIQNIIYTLIVPIASTDSASQASKQHSDQDRILNSQTHLQQPTHHSTARKIYCLILIGEHIKNYKTCLLNQQLTVRNLTPKSRAFTGEALCTVDKISTSTKIQ